jgi:hypothetical protein
MCLVKPKRRDDSNRVTIRAWQILGGEVREDLRPLPKEFNNGFILRSGLVELAAKQLKIEVRGADGRSRTVTHWDRVEMSTSP